MNMFTQGMGPKGPQPESEETVYLSPLALLKMLKHGRAGVPMEVMGLMLGNFVDEYTIMVNDVFAMPQSGTGQNVESIDEVFQAQMMELLRLTRNVKDEIVVGWYHSHPGFSCWLSSVDQQTQGAMEKLHPRAVALVVDPIQSVKGKVVIDCFRLMGSDMLFGPAKGQQYTSLSVANLEVNARSVLHGLFRSYYHMPINYFKTDQDKNILSRLQSKTWTSELSQHSSTEFMDTIESQFGDIRKMADTLEKRLDDYHKADLSGDLEKVKDLCTYKPGELRPLVHLNDIFSNIIIESRTEMNTMTTLKTIYM